MKEATLRNYFIDTDTFINHFISKENICEDEFHEMISCISPEIIKSSYYLNSMVDNNVNDGSTINLLPYLFITDVYIDSQRRDFFYLTLKNYINMMECTDPKVDIGSIQDINTPFLLLCYIYLLQYIFL